LITHRTATVHDLTPRELDVIQLVTNGRSNHEIGAELYLGVNTIKTYIRTAYRKIGVTTRVQAVLWGVHQGLLEGYEIVQKPDAPQSLRAS